ncbi:type II secretion system minor pseudopilin GspH [Ferrimonas lipolytica]|uniref:Type II secretion system protein H n=1 Tax=Ferrimonas lipolytica TaxID=2724191 RepID=A0A6H1UH30_9GAMM|nr:type II secretion system minor pseudopilin GspH [Ferrimonas lipolytica]QIZ78415.1 type II secretion system minor pseudopilin GspH [Ferrimonas lipolytica]
MLHCRHIASQQRGFTLLELLLVITLIGIMATSVAMVLSGDKTREALLESGNEFTVVLGTALEDAELTGELLGVVVEEQRYFFARWNLDDKDWEMVTGIDPLYRERQLPNGIEMSLQLEGLPLAQGDEPEESEFGLDESLFEKSDEEKEERPEPQLLLLPSGEMTAFNLQLSSSERGNKTEPVELVGNPLGQIRWLHELEVE